MSKNKFEWTDELVENAVIYWLSKKSSVGFKESMEYFKKSLEVKPDYEIISFIGKHGNNMRFVLCSESLQYILNNDEYCAYTLRELLGLDYNIFIKHNNKIEKVRRLSDGEVFCIDEIEGKWGKILKFEIRNDLMRAYFDYQDVSAWIELCHLVKEKPKQIILTTEEGIDVYEPNPPIYLTEKNKYGLWESWVCRAIDCINNLERKYFHNPINRDQFIEYNSTKKSEYGKDKITEANFQKIKPKQKLFTTEDGVEVFKDDKFLVYYFHPEDNWELHSVYSNKFNIKFEHKPYYDKKEAEDFILQNKPIQVSLKELLDYIKANPGKWNTEKFNITNFFKAKINL